MEVHLSGPLANQPLEWHLPIYLGERRLPILPAGPHCRGPGGSQAFDGRNEGMKMFIITLQRTYIQLVSYKRLWTQHSAWIDSFSYLSTRIATLPLLDTHGSLRQRIPVK